MIIPPPEHNAKLIKEDKKILAALSQVPAQCDCSVSDVDRLNWLEEQKCCFGFNVETGAWAMDWEDAPWGKTLRDAIDLAMHETKPNAGDQRRP